MVSDKAIVVLIVVAILLSTISIVFTLSSTLSIDNQIVSKVNQQKIPDADRASVGIVINPQPSAATP